MICRKNKPFLLKPAGKDYIWGGNRLNEKFGKGIELYPLAETWECSVHPDGESLVASGEFAGQKLADVLHKHPEFLGSHPGNELPILVKLIDAEKDLSVQVHPDDEYAALYENDNGKIQFAQSWTFSSLNEAAQFLMHRGGENTQAWQVDLKAEEPQKKTQPSKKKKTAEKKQTGGKKETRKFTARRKQITIHES